MIQTSQSDSGVASTIHGQFDFPQFTHPNSSSKSAPELLAELALNHQL
jgi:hypothetical protein